jgi:cytochrome d ubiquinol oxidase subunit I
LTSALVVGLVASAAMPFIGHWHAIQVAETQPVKMAAFESVYQTEQNATLWLFGWVRDDGQRVSGVGIPSGLSLMLGLDPEHEVTGLASVPPEDRPPVQLTFQSYHLMIALSFLLIGIMILALVLQVLKRLEKARWMLWILVLSFPLPLLAINMGWMATEVGRQPWIVQDLLRTEDGVSPVVSAGEVWTTLGLFAVVYLILFIAWARIFFGIIGKGPDDVAEMLEAEKPGTTPVPAGAEG